MRVVGSGLNIRDCKLRTIASVGKLVRLLNEKKDVLWVKWVHRVNMEHCRFLDADPFRWIAVGTGKPCTNLKVIW